MRIIKLYIFIIHIKNKSNKCLKTIKYKFDLYFNFFRFIMNKIIIIKLYLLKNMATVIKNSLSSQLEQMLQKAKPQTRYISEMHVDEYNDQIYKQIINGDLDIPKQKRQFEKKKTRNDSEGITRQKMMSLAQKQKEELQTKLKYLSNSINLIKKYQQKPLNQNSRVLRESYIKGTSKARDQKWRKEIKERQKELEQKKKKIQQQKLKKQQQQSQFSARLLEQRGEKKKKQLIQKMKFIQERSKIRDQQIKVGNQRYSKVKNKKSMYQKINQAYQEKQLLFLEQQKRKLAEIRDLRRPINQQELKLHEDKFLQMKKQKQQLRDRQRRVASSRTKQYKPMYESVFYRKVIQDEKNQQENPGVAKKQKVKQFSTHVKQHFVPTVSDRKKRQMDEMINKQKRKQQERQQRDRQLLQKSKIKGLQYLQQLRSIPKKKQDSSKLSPPPTQRIKYHNYLTHHSEKAMSRKQWSKILNSTQDEETKAIHLQMESERKQQELKRRQQQVRLMKKGDSNQIDQEYFSMIRAKLDLLKNDI